MCCSVTYGHDKRSVVRPIIAELRKRMRWR